MTEKHPDSKSEKKHKPTQAGSPTTATGTSTSSGQPVFAQPQPSPDPTGFKTPVTDQSDKEFAQVEAVPEPVGNAVEPILTLAQVYGSAGDAKTSAITQSGQIVFHSVGDTGSVEGPTTQSLVADKMVSDFDEDDAADVPSFFFHLGDVVYYFGEAAYYYDQFYEPYRNYPAPIVAIPGNHDGVVYKADPAPTLAAFLTNFVSPSPVVSPDAGGLVRTAQIQPGVYFTFDAPFVRILGLYSNVLEDPGVISDESGTYTTLDQRQIDFLTTALKRIVSESYAGAVIVAVHHPPYTGGSVHGGSPKMLADIDACCTAAGFWPHAVFSGHSHNYQRYTRTVNGGSTPYIVAGCGGHSPLSTMRGTYRTPYKIDDTLTLESYDDTDYGYLRIVVNAETMTIEFHPEADGATTKTPDDTVTINLSTRTLS
ncbi:metallophosphoesterase family protein [Silvibacterium sp.]|uniref:metallophosphoesterase family protein n=1 Tax=Silvibacterium sp. TaxID=1964179 RepID=UPI0039E64FA2